MVNFRYSVAISAAAMVLSFATSENVFAATGTKFLDFADGTAGYSVNGSAVKYTTTVTTNYGGQPFSLTPATGEAMLRLTPQGANKTVTSIDAFLNLTSDTTLGVVGATNTTNYGAIV